MQLLPRMIRQNIRLTRKLRFSYIWIDSFCIFQDSSDDLGTGIFQGGEDVCKMAVLFPLRSRAWGFQEWLLSRHTLYMKRLGMEWDVMSVLPTSIINQGSSIEVCWDHLHLQRGWEKHGNSRMKKQTHRRGKQPNFPPSKHSSIPPRRLKMKKANISS